MQSIHHWTFDRTANYLRYSLKRPEGVHPRRWSAMVKQVGIVYGWGWLAQF